MAATMPVSEAQMVKSVTRTYPNRLRLVYLGIALVGLSVSVASAVALGGAFAGYLPLLFVGAISLFMVLARDMGALWVLLFFAAASQRPLSGLPGSSSLLWLDDLVVIGIVLAIISRWPEVREAFAGRFFLVVLLVAGLLLAVYLAPSFDLGVLQFRQVLVPVVLVISGALVDKSDIRVARRVAILLGVVAAVYAILEFFGVRLIDPNLYVSGQGEDGEAAVRDLPGFYYYFLDFGNYIVRSGTFLLNPPSGGIFIASAFAWLIALRTRFSVRDYLLAGLMIAGVATTLSRAAALIVILVVLQPLLIRRFGRVGFVLFGSLLAGIAFQEIASHGSSARHSEGLVQGVLLGISSPLFGAFGRVGNATKDWSGEGYGESAMAIFLSGAGWIGLVIVCLMLVSIYRGAAGTLSAVAAAALAASCFSETAVGLDASAMLWTLAGVGLLKAPDGVGLLATGSAVDPSTFSDTIGEQKRLV
ncbi:hypothetical protein [Microbacterium excoecariae]|uniref:hypothetical protein n=1 Tax=Microbacterium excoecariae TaxID=2715210 RepID=UPI00140DF9AB|nr:hypothetical protein [Microbacterium excoecariae]NHI18007.1 hypothetical protein [Microbacterium excoecariae]